ncbi:MAG: hypothetical protein WBG71_11900 [Leeuwenhoekiella sp.]
MTGLQPGNFILRIASVIDDAEETVTGSQQITVSPLGSAGFAFSFGRISGA